MTEKEKMLNGEPYNPADKQLSDIRATAHKLSQIYNTTFETEEKKRIEILDELLPNRGKNCFLQGPIQFDYGIFTSVGDNVFFGPNCTVATALHYFDPIERRIRVDENGEAYDIEFGKPITIGNDCWIASNVVICAGVTIGDNCTIGAGSVVTRDIPPNSLAAGNPCRVIRKIDKEK